MAYDLKSRPDTFTRPKSSPLRSCSTRAPARNHPEEHLRIMKALLEGRERPILPDRPLLQVWEPPAEAGSLVSHLASAVGVASPALRRRSRQRPPGLET
jgi:hypothetical protein